MGIEGTLVTENTSNRENSGNRGSAAIPSDFIRTVQIFCAYNITADLPL